MRRREVLQAAVLAALGSAGQVARAAQGPQNVVKFLLFSCPICRAAEGIDPAIAGAASATGGRLVQAPLPVEGDYSAHFYYAARQLAPAFEEKVRASLYKGVQDMGIPMNDAFRVFVWLQQDLGAEKDFPWNGLMQMAAGSEVRSALGRAARLAASMGLTNTPSYVLVADNRPVALYDPTSVTPANSLSALRDTVITRINDSN
jgi:protein-disulfide isomerase